MTAFTIQKFEIKYHLAQYKNKLDILKQMKYSKFHTESNNEQNW